MKSLTTSSLIVIAALLIGCDSGGGGTTSPSSSGTNNSSANNTSTGSFSSQSAQSFQSIDATNIAGNTVFTKNVSSGQLNGDVEEFVYIFETEKKVKVILSMINNTQLVYDCKYSLKDDAFGKSIQMEYKDVSTGDSGTFTLTLNDANELVLGNDPFQIQGHPISKILPNDKNGVVIKDNTASRDGFTINSMEDIRGYSIISNVSHPGTSGITLQTKVTFNCDYTHDYEIITGYKGTNDITKSHGTSANLEESFKIKRLAWDGVDEDGEPMNDSIDLDVNSQLIPGTTCWSGYSGDSCSNDHYIESIIGSGC